jgi:acetyl esterase/lipase
MYKRVLSFVILLLTAISAAAVDSINIWEGTPCTANVGMEYYPAGNGTGPACIVCPGGSYFWLDKETEGQGVAKWLNENGITAFVLHYRVGGVPAFITHYRLLGGGNKYPYMLQDVQRAIQVVRENADKYGINGNQLGVMGFSAGGHLSIMSGEFFDSDMLSLVGVECSTDLKPNFIAPIYPVVSLSAPCTHKRSRRGILGDKNAGNQALRDSLSLEKHVRADMPPVFLMNCKDDPIVNYHNSELLDSAMHCAGVKHKYVQYSTGGHGFGATAAKTSAQAIGWKEEFLNWLNSIL